MSSGGLSVTSRRFEAVLGVVVVPFVVLLFATFVVSDSREADLERHLRGDAVGGIVVGLLLAGVAAFFYLFAIG